MDARIMGSPCPKCGGCDYYCADCYDKQEDGRIVIQDVGPDSLLARMAVVVNAAGALVTRVRECYVTEGSSVVERMPASEFGPLVDALKAVHGEEAKEE